MKDIVIRITYNDEGCEPCPSTMGMIQLIEAGIVSFMECDLQENELIKDNWSVDIISTGCWSDGEISDHSKNLLDKLINVEHDRNYRRT